MNKQTYTCRNCQTVFAFKGYSNTHVFCSLDCNYAFKATQATAKHDAQYVDWLAGIPIAGVKNQRPIIRKYLTKRDGYNCAVCGISEWNGKEITLWVDHIDGDATNNAPTNFRLVCPNCDSQGDTFGAKNYGKGRKSKGLPQYG